MEIIIYEKSNPDHVLFCLLMKQISNKNFLFLDYYEMQNSLDYEEIDSITFLQYLPKANFFKRINENKTLTRFIFYCDKEIITKQNIDEEIIENIYNTVIFKYARKDIEYKYVSDNFSWHLFQNQVNLLGNTNPTKLNSIGTLISLLNLSTNSNNYNNNIIQYLFNTLLSNSPIEIIEKNIYKDGITSLINQIHYNIDINDNMFFRNLKSKYDLIYRDSEYFVIKYSDNMFLLKTNSKEYFDNFVTPEDEFTYTKLIQISTTNIKQSLLEHDLIVNMFKQNSYDKMICDYIEYFNPITNQSIFVPFNYLLGFKESEENTYKLSDTEILKLEKYKSEILLPKAVDTQIYTNLQQTEINKLLNINPNDKIDDYRNPIVDNINLTFNENLNIQIN